MFGDWDGIILRILITIAVVVVLAGIAWWLMRRYSATGIGGIGRGRVPRLAVLDALAIDARRRLVLVRRDNVEHLLLIGGPSDVVVEQAIQRPRARPAAKTAAGAPAPTPQPFPPLEPSGPESEPPLPPLPLSTRASPPIYEQPAPHRPSSDFRSPPPELEPPPPPSYQSAPQPIERPYPPIRRPSATRSEPPPAPTTPIFDRAPEPSPPPPSAPTEPEAAADLDALPEFLRPRPGDPASFTPTPEPEPAPGDDTAAKVNDLEREMARLLGEITQKH